MKIKSEHYEFLRDNIGAIIQHLPAVRAIAAADGRTKDIERRTRWDMLAKANLSPWICKNIYSYADDNHLDTALKKIIAYFEKRAAA